jgi:hypothetical protein
MHSTEQEQFGTASQILSNCGISTQIDGQLTAFQSTQIFYLSVGAVGSFLKT